MKTWNIPSVEELEVKLTASSGVPGNTEGAGYLDNGWHDAIYDTSIYEKTTPDAVCTIPIEESAGVES